MTIQLNPTVSDPFERKTLAQIRAKIMAMLRFSSPLEVDRT